MAIKITDDYFKVEFIPRCKRPIEIVKLIRHPGEIVESSVYHPYSSWKYTGDFSQIYSLTDELVPNDEEIQFEVVVKNADDLGCKSSNINIEFLDNLGGYKPYIEYVNYFGEKRLLAPQEEGKALITFKLPKDSEDTRFFIRAKKEVLPSESILDFTNPADSQLTIDRQ